MTLPLWILAGGSVLAGWLWIPHLFLPFEHWLEPVMGHPAGHGEVGTELTLMAVSVVVAVLGIGLAWLMYYRGSFSPDTFANAIGGLPHRLVYDKYYVDELYELIFVRGGLALCRLSAWFDNNVIDGIVNLSAAVVRAWAWIGGKFDDWVVDGAVNLVATLTQFTGRRIRNLQTGAINSYLYVVIMGVLASVLLYWSWASAS
jgi:NADH-quinone oxidoreductase subunit L